MKKQNDYRYQTMKQYQGLWHLSDTDVNYLYGVLAKYDQSLAEYRLQYLQRLSRGSLATQPDSAQTELQKQMEAELLQSLGEDRLRRFKAAGVIQSEQ
jgi:hypothetical protein